MVMSAATEASAVLMVSSRNCDARLRGKIDLQSVREARVLVAACPVAG